MKVMIWRSDNDNMLFHDLCFNAGESREGYTAVSLNELTDDDTCESCGGLFLIGIVETGHTPDDDEDSEDEDSE